MLMIVLRKVTRVVCTLLLSFCAVDTIAEDRITYDDHVASILKRHCLQCHGESKQEAGLDLSSYASIAKGGSGGAIVVAGRSNASRIVQAITAEDPDERMPPKSDPLSVEQITTIRKWIDAGLLQNAKSQMSEKKSVGFMPTERNQVVSVEEIMPSELPTFERPKLKRPYPVLALASNPIAPLVSVGSYGAIEFINPASRASIGTLPFSSGEPMVLRFSHSGRTLLAAGGQPVQHGEAVLYDVKSGKKLLSLGDEPDTVMAADISPDERRIGIGGSGHVAKIYSTEDGSLLYKLAKHTDWITSIAFSPDGKLVATGDRIGNIHLWDANNGGVILPLAEHKGAIHALSWRSDSLVMTSCGEDGLIVCWDIAKGFPLRTFPNAHPPIRPAGEYGKIPNGVLDVCYGSTDEFVSCGRDSVVRVWSDSGKELKSFRVDSDASSNALNDRNKRSIPIRTVISADGMHVVAGDFAGQVHSWPLK